MQDRASSSSGLQYPTTYPAAPKLGVNEVVSPTPSKDAPPEDTDAGLRSQVSAVPSAPQQPPRALRGYKTQERLQKKVQATEQAFSKRLEALRRATVRQDMLQRRAERRMKEGQTHRRKQTDEAETLQREEEAVAQEACLEAVRAAHRQRFRELDLQRRQIEETQQRWNALQRDREVKAREARAREEQECRDQHRRMREEQERQAEQARLERERLEYERLERERLERERLERERLERERREREERERREHAERQRRERRSREERERTEQQHRAQEARQRQVDEEKERRAHETGVRGECQTEQQILELYELKWAELKMNHDLQNIVGFHEFPFPLLAYQLSDPTDVTYQRVRDFIFHPRRRSTEGKTRKEIVKGELLRWHPDKFDALIRSKVRQDDWPRTKEAAGTVARLVTRLMGEA